MDQFRIEQIEKLAWEIRKLVGADRIDNPDLISVITTDISSIYGSIAIIPASADQIRHNEAEFRSETGQLFVQYRILTDLENGEKRARFTMAHELGHIVLRHKGHLNRNTYMPAYVRANYGAAEAEANYFASAFLVPEPLVSTHVDSFEISERFQLSHEASERRCEEIRSFRRRSQKEKRPLPPTVVDFLAEMKKRGLPVKSI